MSLPQTDRTPRVARPTPDDERGWLGLMLDLLPFPALVVDTGSAAVVLGNPLALDVPLGLPLESDAPDTHRVELGEVRVGAGDLASAASGPGGVEVACHVPGGSHRFRVHSRPMPPADGMAPLALLTFQDVTERRATEEELRRALEVRDEFFSIATHELKDPLFSLQLSNQLLSRTAVRQGQVPAYLLHHLEVSRRQIERLGRLIDNLLDVSRIMNRRLQLDIEALDLVELVAEVAGRFRERAEAAGTSIGAEPRGPVIGYFDRLKLEQILGNLLANAIKYGGGRPVVARVLADEETATLEVEDQGPGLSLEDQARVFERFERASTGHRKESLGLGLYIVRSLAEAHGGSVGVRSEPGRGATFVVSLPRKRLPAEAGSSDSTTSQAIVPPAGEP